MRQQRLVMTICFKHDKRDIIEKTAQIQLMLNPALGQAIMGQSYGHLQQ